MAATEYSSRIKQYKLSCIQPSFSGIWLTRCFCVSESDEYVEHAEWDGLQEVQRPYEGWERKQSKKEGNVGRIGG